MVPTIYPTIAICETEISSHTLEFKDAACSLKADRGLLLAAKALALTGLEILKNPAVKLVNDK
ncbi:MAG: hypothetical protein RR427_12070 [Cellulosilyticaceae bacterium]